MVRDLPRMAVPEMSAGLGRADRGGGEEAPESLGPPEIAAEQLLFLRLVADGLTDKAIADRCAVPYGRVRMLVWQAMRSWDAPNRTTLVVKAFRAGLI